LVSVRVHERDDPDLPVVDEGRDERIDAVVVEKIRGKEVGHLRRDDLPGMVAAHDQHLRLPLRDRHVVRNDETEDVARLV